jgi:ubiquinone biosynthesis protein UbiJ
MRCIGADLVKMKYMIPIPFPIPTTLNHFLSREPWAMDKLAAHAGKVACIDSGLVKIRLKVAADGLLQSAATHDAANVTIRVKLADLPLIAQNRERAFSYVRIEGDADFANTISQLFRSLRWDAEEDLSRYVGDIAAARLAASARAVFDSARSTQKKLAENAAEYFLEENPMLVRTHSVAEFAGEVSRLRDDVERLAKRIERLKGSAA